MGALAANRATRHREGKNFQFAVAANKHVYAGSLVNTNAAGYALPAADEVDSIFLGVALSEADNNPGSAGAKTVRIGLVGVFLFNKASAAQSDVGKDMYVVDDQTVGLVGTTTNDIKVGRCVGIEGTTQVWVAIDNPGATPGTAPTTTTTTSTTTTTTTSTTTTTTSTTTTTT